MRIRPLVITLSLLAASSTADGQFGPQKVTVAKAEMRPLPVSLTLVGTVEPATRSLIATEVAGIVEEMPVREGDRLEKGQRICKLNDDTVSLQLREAKARLQNLESQLAELEAGTRQTELERLKALYESARAEFDRWTNERERVHKLYGDEQSNQKEVYDTEAGYRSAEQQMLAAKAQYELGVEGPRAEQIEQARFAVAAQQAVVHRLERDLAKTEIRAPFSGFVVRRAVEVGEWVSQGSAIVELADLGQVLITVDVPEQAVPFVQVGNRAAIQIDALKDRFEGAVKHVIPQADEAARTFPVEIEVPNDPPVLKSGMFARATTVAGPEQTVVAVPKDSVSHQMGASYVALVRPGQGGQMMAFPTPVTVGLDIGDWIEITSGNIAAGTEVVVRGNEMISRMIAPAPVEIVGPDAVVDQTPPRATSQAADSSRATDPSTTPPRSGTGG
jgi:multidrug efflux pump subunit AcrA (membrane-fusion protein)